MKAAVDKCGSYQLGDSNAKVHLVGFDEVHYQGGRGLALMTQIKKQNKGNPDSVGLLVLTA